MIKLKLILIKASTLIELYIYQYCHVSTHTHFAIIGTHFTRTSHFEAPLEREAFEWVVPSLWNRTGDPLDIEGALSPIAIREPIM